MFKSYEFTYAGMPASMFGMYIADMSSNKHSANSFGNKANLVETRLANRVAPIHYGVRYNDSPLSFTLIFGADHKLDRYEMQAVSKWLTGYQEYQWLSIDQPGYGAYSIPVSCSGTDAYSSQLGAYGV